MLRLENVDVHVEGVHVLRSISFALVEGAVTGLVGRNGAGKTTTLRCVMGLVPHTAGAIRLGDTRLDDHPAHTRTALGIGYAPEDRRLFGAFSVEDNLRLPMEVLKCPADEIDARLEEVFELLPEVAAMRKRPAGSVSGGEGKMVALGRALVTGQRLVLLDEPFQGLAPALASRYAAALHRLRERADAPTLLITESNPALLADLADKMLIIERGEIHAEAAEAV